MNICTAVLLCFTAATLCSSKAYGDDMFLVRVMADLEGCKEVDSPLCQGVPARLADHGKRAVPRIRRAYLKLSPAGRVLALMAIKQIPHVSATRMLIRWAKKSEFMVRAVAISSLGERSGSVVDSTLRSTLRGDNPTFRALAAEALGQHKSKRNVRRACNALISATRDTVKEVRIKSYESLGLLGCKNGRKQLVRALKSDAKRERIAALFGLRFLGDKRAIPAVMEVLKDEDMIVSEDAGKTLKQLTGQNYGTDYALWKAWLDTQQSEE